MCCVLSKLKVVLLNLPCAHLLLFCLDLHGEIAQRYGGRLVIRKYSKAMKHEFESTPMLFF